MRNFIFVIIFEGVFGAVKHKKRKNRVLRMFNY